MQPSDIITAYNLTGVSANGSGQTLGLFELAGYTPSDVNHYASYFGLPSIPLQNVSVDGGPTCPTDYCECGHCGEDEVTLDIELQMALAQGASKIMVYEGSNTDTAVVDTYNRMATDNLAKQISTSWGLDEGDVPSTDISAENTIFQQMAAQGQSIYAASGDQGAYGDWSTLSVDDPGSQPYMVGVGGTQLFLNSDGSYNHETTWNVDNTVDGGAGGGGVSSIWTIPDWQKGTGTAASATMRNVPDISLNADQYTGYSIYYNGHWHIFGGTSAASPLWAAFTARVNQERAANGKATLGFANPLIYQIAEGASYNTDFHDIADGSTNLYYSALTGYDNATGWGSFNGANLFLALSTMAAAPTATTNAATGITASGATLNGTVNANNASTTVTFQYGLTTAYGSTVTADQSPVTGSSNTAMSKAITGLQVNTTYHFRVVGVNKAGTTNGGDLTFTTQAAAPKATTNAATNVTQHAATLNGTVNAHIASTTVTFQYGLTTAYGTTVTASPSTVTGNSNTAVSKAVTGLKANTTYHYRVVGVNSAGTTYGGDLTFKTTGP